MDKFNLNNNSTQVVNMILPMMFLAKRHQSLNEKKNIPLDTKENIVGFINDIICINNEIHNKEELLIEYGDEDDKLEDGYDYFANYNHKDNIATLYLKIDKRYLPSMLYTIEKSVVKKLGLKKYKEDDEVVWEKYDNNSISFISIDNSDDKFSIISYEIKFIK